MNDEYLRYLRYVGTPIFSPSQTICILYDNWICFDVFSFKKIDKNALNKTSLISATK
jgi:hypothetical protein